MQLHITRKTVRRFSSLGDDRSAITADFALDPAGGAVLRSQMAAVVSSWEAARDFIETDNSLKAEARVLGTPRALSSSDMTALRRAVEAAFGGISEKECPSNSYIASKLEELEDGELLASPLDEIVSREDGGAAQLDLSSSLDSQGRLRVPSQSPRLGCLPPRRNTGPS